MENMIMNSDAIQNELIGALNDLSGASDSQLVKVFNDEGAVFLESLQSQCLRDYVLPKIEDVDGFIKMIKHLKNNHSEWNRRLGELIIDLYSDRQESAKKNLYVFYEGCPWLTLARVAKTSIDSVNK
jgi:hypothetical protein